MEMFAQTFVEGTGKTHKPWTTMVGFSLNVLVVGILVIAPMIWTDVLPVNALRSALFIPPPPPPPPPPPAETPKVVQVKIIPRQFDSGRLMQPKSIPTAIAVIKEDELPPPSAGGIAGGIGNSTSGLLSGILSGPAPVAVAAPVKKEEKKVVQRINVGGRVAQASLIHSVQPVYPPLARSTRIQGHVILSAVISTDGTIKDLQLVSGHPLLVPAAMAAVKQWVYKPTLLNDEPVEVSTQIDVNFTLQ
jgi:protein TonB